MKKIIILLLLFIPLAALSAETEVLSDLEFYNTVYRGIDEWHFLPSGNASLSFRSVKNSNVQGHTEIEFFPVDLYGAGASTVPALNVKRAYVRTRFPGFRMTLGKSRLVWGQGTVFNAGDVVFGSLNPVLDLTQTELRSDTAWLTSVNVPLGPFSFVEGVVLPPAFEISETGLSTPGLDKTSLGGRFYFLAGGLKFEGGYLYKGQTKVDGDVIGHRPYISLQGNIGPDWYLSSSLAVPTEQQKKDNPGTPDWKETWMLSLGFFHMQEINRNNTLNLRLETLCFPFQNWENRAVRDTVYGLYLYPEISWTTGDGTFYSVQSVISPMDASAMITGGAGWNIYQGLFLVGYATFMAGDDTSTFAWNRGDQWDSSRDYINGMSFMTGLRYKF
ncbi:MAG: hypothetical protein PQJ58_12195 [Spirochaetales bacterium]|nr:hypothetical protein [Spirochaetales bacterium]